MKPYTMQNGREVKWVNGWFRTRTEAKAACDGCEPVKMTELFKGDMVLSEKVVDALLSDDGEEVAWALREMRQLR